MRTVVYSGWPRLLVNSSFIRRPENSSAFSFTPTLIWLLSSLKCTSLNSISLSAAASTRIVSTSLLLSSVVIDSVVMS